MKIVSFSEVSAADDWDTLCDQSGEAWLFHRRQWIAIETAHFGHKNRSFAVMQGNKLVAVHPLYRSDESSGAANEQLLHSGIHRHTGLACADELGPSDRKAVQTVAMRHIVSVAHMERVHRIQLNAQNLAPVNRGPGREEIPFWVLDHGYYLGLNLAPSGIAPAPGMATCNADQIVGLREPEEKLFARLDESCRRAVRKASAAKLAFALAETDAVMRYFALAQCSARRTGETLAPLSYFEDLWRHFEAQGRCAIVIVRHDGADVAALLLGIDKGAATFLGGVSDPAALHLRVNDYVHWQAMLWLKNIGVETYRLGPIFPEVPEDWPIARVSRFKRKFGGRSVPIIQGSYFISPEHYLERGTQSLIQRCLPVPNLATHEKTGAAFPMAIHAAKADRDSLSIVLACYGLVRGAYAFVNPNAGFERGGSVIFLSGLQHSLPGVSVCLEEAQEYLFEVTKATPRWWRRKLVPCYRPLLPFVSLIGPGIEPLWVTSGGRAVVALQRLPNGSVNLLIGLDFVEEVVRYRQGDPAKVDAQIERGGFGFDFERPMYLYRDQIDPVFPHFPWADMLGFFVAEQIASIGRAPLLDAFPNAAKGVVIFTGDDDQAYLETYAEQLKRTHDLPITYFLVPQTRHTKETLSELPSRVEIGVHPDALDAPQNYDSLCEEQTEFVRTISCQPVRTVRNHGFLNRGYLGHLAAWEHCGLSADVNCPGTDGTALNGSLLPMRVRRANGTWSEHSSLLTTFGDGMIFGLNLTPRESVKRIWRTVALVERGHPGVVVFNLHPQNVMETKALHATVVTLARRHGWRAYSLGQLVDWFSARTQIVAEKRDGAWLLVSSTPIESLSVRISTQDGWKKAVIKKTSDTSFLIDAPA